MSTPLEARAALAAALQADEVKTAGIRFVDDLAGRVTPPGVLVGPPLLEWEAYCREPTSARFVVHLAVAANERAVYRLLELLPVVTDALEQTDATVVNAAPGVWLSDTSELPCYDILTEVAL